MTAAALAACVIATGCVSERHNATTEHRGKRRAEQVVHEEIVSSVEIKATRSFAYQVQRESVQDDCMPPSLVRILAHIRAETGVKPVLTSGHRSHGRRNSQHRACRAADIRVPGVRDSAVIAAARRAPGIGGIGRYCNGIIHVDVGPSREWTYCRSRRSRRG